jgi:hypothetical protein
VAAATLAAGVVDGHGVGDGDGVGDLYELTQLVPDEADRERIMDLASQLMKHPQFLRVRDAIRVKLQFKDVLYRDELERIAHSVTDPGAITSERSAALRRRTLDEGAGATDMKGKGVNAAVGDPVSVPGSPHLGVP